MTEKFFTPDELQGATGAFYTGTAAEVVGIAAIDELEFSVPFAETLGARLGERYRALVTGVAVEQSA